MLLSLSCANKYITFPESQITSVVVKFKSMSNQMSATVDGKSNITQNHPDY